MILLDTHTWWWAISEPEKLSDIAYKVIADTHPGHHCIASISLWEFVMMAERGRIELELSPSEWLSFALGPAKTQIIPLSAAIALDSCNLPGVFHKDPATARISHLKLITKDRKIREYEHIETIW